MRVYCLFSQRECSIGLTVIAGFIVCSFIILSSCTSVARPDSVSIPGNPERKGLSFNLDGSTFDFVPLPSGKVMFGKYEVTNEQYRLYKSEHNSVRRVFFGEVHASEMAKHGINKDAHPAVKVRQSEAVEYCKWLTQELKAKGIIKSQQQIRLPRKDEWIKACKGGREVDFPWGKQWPPPCGNLRDAIAPDTDRHVMTCSVYETCSNISGVHGLAGNVAEWLDQKSASGEPLAIGGSFISSRKHNCRCEYVRTFLPHLMPDWVGFRLVLD